MPKAKETADDAVHYEILHTQVGPFLQGRVVTAEDFGVDDEGEPVNIERLLTLEAVAETDKPLTEEPAPLNAHNMPQVDSAGRIADVRGQDRPTVASHIAPSVVRRRQQEALTAHEAENEAAAEAAEGEQMPADYNDWERKDLLTEATNRQLHVSARATKEQLVTALTESDAATQ